MSENPFIFGKPVSKEDFYNRKDEIEVAVGFIRSLQSFSVIGERRIGKTSFLQHILSDIILKSHGIDPKRYVVLIFNMSSLLEDTKEKFIEALVEEIRQQTRIKLEEGDIFDTLSAYIKRIASECKNLVIALDELEEIAHILDNDFSHWLRFIFQEQNVLAITASQKRISELEESGGRGYPLFNIFATLRLGLFSSIEARNMIQEMFCRGGIELKEEEMAFLADLSGRNPYFIQFIGHHYYEEKKKEVRIAFKEFEEKMLFYLGDTFEGYWKSLTNEERECLLNVDESKDQVCYILEKKGYLFRENKKWKIFSKIFGKFIDMKKKEEVEEEMAEKKKIEEEVEKYPFAAIMAISALLISIVLSFSIFMDFISKPVPAIFTAISVIIIIFCVLIIPSLYLLRRWFKYVLKSWLRLVPKRWSK